MLAVTDKKPKGQIASESSAEVNRSPVSDASGSETLNGERLQIINWLKEVRFRKQLIGGINEQDVWKKIDKLNEMYDTALKAERIRYDVLLEQQSKTTDPSLQTGDPTKEIPVDE